VEAAAHRSGAAMRPHRAHTSNRRVPDETKFKINEAIDTKAEARKEKS
jgi:hypothetical protein